MIKALLNKLKESFISITPVSLIVVILSLLNIINLSSIELLVFIITSICLIIGMALFNLGADIAMTPMGEHIGAGLTKSKKLSLLLIICFIMGLLITIAEPDLTVLAKQISSAINPTLVIIFVGLGVGLFLLIAILKIVFKSNLTSILMFFYLILFAICSLLMSEGKNSFIPMSFDSGGVTTGPVTVPFIMALGVGVSKVIGGRNSNENTFGLVALCSVGPIIAIMMLSLFGSNNITYSLSTSEYDVSSYLGINLLNLLASNAFDIFKAIGLICLFFILLQIFILKLPKRKLIQIAIGIIYTFFGLLIFLTSVSIGFLPMGYKIGATLATSKVLLITFGFILGMVVVIAEPAIHVLNNQVENITEGQVSKRSMLIALSIGVGISIGLSMIRIIFNFSILFYLIPGYLISLGLSFFVPRMYTAIAFDSGGVASGPLTSSFILPLAIGAVSNLYGDVEILNLAFGIVSMVALTPLISIQLLGFKSLVTYKVKERISIKRIYNKDDEQIIKFM